MLARYIYLKIRKHNNPVRYSVWTGEAFEKHYPTITRFVGDKCDFSLELIDNDSQITTRVYSYRPHRWPSGCNLIT